MVLQNFYVHMQRWQITKQQTWDLYVAKEASIVGSSSITETSFTCSNLYKNIRQNRLAEMFKTNCCCKSLGILLPVSHQSGLSQRSGSTYRVTQTWLVSWITDPCTSLAKLTFKTVDRRHSNHLLILLVPYVDKSGWKNAAAVQCELSFYVTSTNVVWYVSWENVKKSVEGNCRKSVNDFSYTSIRSACLFSNLIHWW